MYREKRDLKKLNYFVDWCNISVLNIEILRIALIRIIRLFAITPLPPIFTICGFQPLLRKGFVYIVTYHSPM